MRANLADLPSRGEMTGCCARFVHRWWTLADLHAASERLVPAVLATALETLLREGPPAEPVDVGV